ISTLEDHIAPWRATYPATRILSGPVQFVLGGSGHIAGIINPPGKNKYGYWTADRYPDRADDWLQGAERHEGSWWPPRAGRLASYSGDLVAARPAGNSEFPPLSGAPGAYVLGQ